MKNDNLAIGSAFGASLLIGSCCLAPALFLLFGVSIGGLGALSQLEPYRPLFMAIGGAALAYAAWRAWRPAQAGAQAECADGTCAPDSSRRRRTRQLVAIAAIVYALAITYPTALAALL